MFTKVLIANRGEIAVRILRACRELGIATVAVYSTADQRALHVRMADEAVWVGEPPAGQSYLVAERILEAAQKTGAQAIHPGYGFLSENAAFARAVQQAGLVFIGPPPEAIEIMGDKGQARARMQAAGVPVAPGYQGPDDLDTLIEKAHEIGFPLLVKAAAGGGGKGMRVVGEGADLASAIDGARHEALQAFGDQRLILERYIPNARHIEFQILADAYSNVLHLFERECSVQRRHQKIIEESPSPFLDASLRNEMGQAAVTAARVVGYKNAGTIEFIVDPQTRRYYFLEMNTRLQVEHAVTEQVTGLDLVQAQFRIASGERLELTQRDLQSRGHAIECRVYAEDPANQFLPATGRLLRYIEPKGPGVRVDSGATTGDEISIYYDPLISKVITWAEDRTSAIRKMEAALRETILLGVTQNVQFLQDVLADPDFRSGTYNTTWVENRFTDWQPPQCALPPEVLAAAALIQFQPDEVEGQGTSVQYDPYSPWGISSGFRMGER